LWTLLRPLLGALGPTGRGPLGLLQPLLDFFRDGPRDRQDDHGDHIDELAASILELGQHAELFRNHGHAATPSAL
jgi:hypothetical protein